ncbi:uncharacterized protein LOC110105627 [Dendrobium catenatum]|uniref:DUF7866 domain-containing protein n=2 Tax=Dendrobium TaxID=37818 RepID=A0A2I0WPG3_9ASPA|nr:uncharacterized protein LOC110105627 [Dendrobium catenatum]PKU77553.1 hypothetical protein MA16_Dca013674 [Dendrobium catenatum]
MASFSWVLPLLFLLFMATISANLSFSAEADGSAGSAMEEMRPVAPVPGIQQLMLNETRRQLSSFQICALCTCCGGPKGLCLPSPCCYAISCNIPNRPFGFCSFLPRTCNCFGCHL